MAKKDYPGLVIVPPSDRTILRRRLLRWSLLLISVAWITWTVLGSPPASQDNTDCQEETREGIPGDPAEECGRPDRATATVNPREDDTSLLQVSQDENPAESPPLIPSPSQEHDGRSPGPTPREDPTPKPYSLPDPPENHTEVQSNKEPSAAPAPVKKLTTNPSPDAKRAEQGDAFAQYRLGKYYARQQGRHAPESISWYKKASMGLRRLAEAGNGQAMYVLGVMYAFGRGVTRNTEEARHWLSQAVRHNVTAARPVLDGLPNQPRANHTPQSHEQAKPRKQQN